MSMRIGFVTCVELGLSCLREIYSVGGAVDWIMTLRDDLAPRKAGRVYVDEFCREHATELAKVRNINDPDALGLLRAQRLDWLFIIGWSQIAGPGVLASVRRGVLGMHPTLLPEGRGRAAIPWAILKGLRETGVTLFQLDAGVDTGPIITQERIPIEPRETATTLYSKVVTAHRSLIRRAWPSIAEGRVVLHPQEEERASYWPGRTPEDGRLDRTMSVAEVDRLVRATTRPYPGAFIDLNGRRLRIWAGVPVGGPSAAAAGGLEIGFCDGYYLASDAAFDPPPEGGAAGEPSRGA